MTITETHVDANTARRLYVAFELASAKWKLAMADAPGRNARTVSIEPFDAPELGAALRKAKARFGLLADAEILAVMEAGRDGFSVHRWLDGLGVDSVVVDPASVEVSRHKRRAKTDRLDSLKLLANLMRHAGGERGVWRVCRVPSEEAEDARHLHRERETLVAIRTQHMNRIKGMLATRGIRVKARAGVPSRLAELRDPCGQPLPPRLRGRVEREVARMELVAEQIALLDAEMHERAEREPSANASSYERKTWQVAQLKGIGPVSSHVIVGELFGWREFKNRREIGGVAGLTPTPYDTGNTTRDQGISKAGNTRVRHMAIEAAWSWLRFQPQSALSIWFRRKFIDGGRRQVKRGIVALARKLLIALWHFVEHGVLPHGAALKQGSPLEMAA